MEGDLCEPLAVEVRLRRMSAAISAGSQAARLPLQLRRRPPPSIFHSLKAGNSRVASRVPVNFFLTF